MVNLLKTSLISFFVFLCPMLFYGSWQVFVLENCDPKFGCVGALQFMLLISTMFGLVSILALIAVALVLKSYSLCWQILVTSVVLGSVFGQLILRSNYLSSIFEMTIAWAGISLLAYLLAVGWSRTINKRSMPQSFE